MSTVVSPFPPKVMEPEQAIAFRLRLREKGAAWWRLRLLPDENGYLFTERTHGGGAWISWEFDDGYKVYIDAGLDSPTLVLLYNGVRWTHLDVVWPGPPTPCPRWQWLAEVDPDPLVFPAEPEDWLNPFPGLFQDRYRLEGRW
jgi:hypothetical protein